MDNNVYLLTAKASGQQILIDAAADSPAIRKLLSEAALDSNVRTKLSLIVTTHRHRDHLRALAEMAKSPGVLTACGDDDADSIAEQTGVKADRRLSQGDIVGVEGIWLSVIRLTGHTPGSVALAYAEAGQPVWVFSGDSLFPGGVGNTDRDPERFDTLFHDVVERIFDSYTDDTVVAPGHGNFTTLGTERPHLAEWAARGW
ncbi:MAG: MBL fold metallo-hydrolase [Propionibacteriaceae bacterium]|jgi:glyoxylase-like metal-dependent hydrolase (beta-lactamase superfamily II)|nr:MBL fold metallo-hydrolase [Propionibacteriaceae bacterium]